MLDIIIVRVSYMYKTGFSSAINPGATAPRRGTWQCASVLMTLAVSAISASCASRTKGDHPAELILRNGAVYTVDAARTWASAIAVTGGRIIYVGSDTGARQLAGPSTRTVDLRGRMVLPAFQDAHVHLLTGGIVTDLCKLYELKTREEVLTVIRTYAGNHPDRSWVRGAGWELPVFPDSNPSKQQLDEVVPDRPAYLLSADGHSGWANSRALAVAGITKGTPDPPNGHIERDPSTGEPSGTLRESAKDLVEVLIPVESPAEIEAALKRALSLANSFGITSVQQPASPSARYRKAEAAYLAGYRALEVRGQLTARVVVALATEGQKDEEQVAGLVAKRRQFDGKRFHATSAKIFADGGIETGTAALLQPYLNRAGDSGKLVMEPDRLARLVTRLDKEGFQVHVHAMGDRAIRAALDAFESARRSNGPRDSRHIMTHLELIDPQDIPRFRVLGMIPTFQPLWAYADSYIKDLTLPALGPSRTNRLYPFASVAKTGAVVAAGSDWPVTSMNPLEAIQVALTRQDPASPKDLAWIPEERMDLATMVAAYTINGAFLNGQERGAGSIEQGEAADLIVLDRNIFELPPTRIQQAKVILTLLEGREVFRSSAF